MTTDRTTTDPAAVRVRNLRKTYGTAMTSRNRTTSRTVEAVRGIDLDIQRGEIFALLGPNGAGKSTTVEILEGYRSRTSGEVSVLGEDPARGGRRWKSRLGIVLQSSAEAGAYRVREQVAHFASLYARPRDVDEVIAAVGLTASAQTRIGKLSGGQRRRLDVALGIVGRPELLFLDEPTTGFDPEARRQFWDLIATLKDEGTTIVLTTHYLDEAARLGDRAGVIAGGRIIALDAVDRLGGAGARVPIVRWRDRGGALQERRVEAPGELVASLVADHGGEPADLEIVRPSLEDVYLDLLGQAEGSSDASAGGAVREETGA